MAQPSISTNYWVRAVTNQCRSFKWGLILCMKPCSFSKNLDFKTELTTGQCLITIFQCCSLKATDSFSPQVSLSLPSTPLHPRQMYVLHLFYLCCLIFVFQSTYLSTLAVVIYLYHESNLGD